MLLGIRYRELPFGVGRDDVDAVLAGFKAERCGESGSPAFEVNNEYFRIGPRKLRVCTEDEMFVALWGPKGLVDDVYGRIIERWEARKAGA